MDILKEILVVLIHLGFGFLVGYLAVYIPQKIKDAKHFLETLKMMRPTVDFTKWDFAKMLLLNRDKWAYLIPKTKNTKEKE